MASSTLRALVAHIYRSALLVELVIFACAEMCRIPGEVVVSGETCSLLDIPLQCCQQTKNFSGGLCGQAALRNFAEEAAR